MINVKDLLFEVCGDRAVYEDGIDLIDSGLLDSLALIELFNALEDEGIELQPTRIARNLLRTPAGIETLIGEYRNELG
ncbi:MAG: D-alanine--poly(phosphoribitol) ligase subunit 2 [Lachnospiraceae bacterium]|nr:D-alanine--poly(phosphoribitol) ligase subunit 2 [Lachnospiraceae bacterium]